MKATKFIAFMAVMVMLAAPIAAVVAVDQESQGANSPVIFTSKTGTHIKLTDLDEKELSELFDVKLESDKSPQFGPIAEYIMKGAVGALVPGLNLEGLKEVNKDTFKLSGVDIQLDYARGGSNGNVDGVVAITIDVDEFYIEFKGSYAGIPMLVSDAMASYTKSGLAGLPADKLVDMESDLEEEFNKLATFFDNMKWTVGANKEAIQEALTNGTYGYEKFYTEFIGPSPSDATNTWSLGENYGYVPIMDYADRIELVGLFTALQDALDKTPFVLADAKAAQQKIIDFITEWLSQDVNKGKIVIYYNSYAVDAVSYYKAINVYSWIQSIVANGDYAEGLEKAYKGKMFDGTGVTLSGSAHFTLYLESSLRVQEVKEYDSNDEYLHALMTGKLFPKMSTPNFHMYAITESGLNAGILVKLIPGLYNLIYQRFSEGAAMMVATIGTAVPINVLKAEIGLNTNVDHAGECATFSTGAALDFNCDFIFEYNDVNALFNRSLDQGFVLKAKELSASFKTGSYFTYNGESYYNGGIDLIDEKELKDIMSGINGQTWYETPADHSTYTQLSNTGYVSPYAFIINDKVYPFSDFTGRTASFYCDYIDYSPKINFDHITKLFHLREGPYVDEEIKAKAAIAKLGGECSHDISTAIAGATDIYESMYEPEKKSDNSMTVLWIVLAVILILAVIGFAAVLYKSKRA